MGKIENVVVPDIGEFDDVDVVEVFVAPGARVEAEESLITLESEKASMEIPSPHAGVVREVKVNVGDKVREGTLIVRIEVDAGESDGAAAAPATDEAPPPAGAAATPTAVEPTLEPTPVAAEPPPPDKTKPPPPPALPSAGAPTTASVHASPAVRRLAREFGVDLAQVDASGRKGRILKEDVQRFVKQRLAQPTTAGAAALPQIPAVDFSKFGEIELQPLSRINKLTARNMHRSWLNVPAVTQFDEADISELEDFRKEQGARAQQEGYKLTFVSFLLKACAATLQALPRFNASLDPSGESLILKKYIHIGVAVDTPDGLIVPVIRDVHTKGLFDLARELKDISERARVGKLNPKEMQGASFTVSSLGGIGGTAFTPIVNAPEVAILGVARARMQPVYQDGTFVPRLILPFSVTYDHRVIDGAAGARFTTHLAALLADVRRILL